MTEYTLKKKEFVKNNEQKTLFHRLIICYISCVCFEYLFFLMFGTENTNNSSKFYFEYSKGVNFFMIIVYLTHLVGFYFLYNFKNIGRLIFLFTLNVMVLSSFFYNLDVIGLSYFLYNIRLILLGGILILIYFSDLKKDFNK